MVTILIINIPVENELNILFQGKYYPLKGHSKSYKLCSLAT